MKNESLGEAIARVRFEQDPLGAAITAVKLAEERNAEIHRLQLKHAEAFEAVVRAREGKTADEKPDVTLESFKAGGKGALSFPQDHVAAMQVPKGGSCCKNCKYVDVEAHACKSAHYVRWNGGSSKLPDLGLDEICSDWYEPGEALT